MSVGFNKTTQDDVHELAAGGTATFMNGNDNGAIVQEVQLVGTSASTFKLDGGPVRSLLNGERLVIIRSCKQVTCVSGSMEVIFSL